MPLLVGWAKKIQVPNMHLFLALGGLLLTLSLVVQQGVEKKSTALLWLQASGRLPVR